MSDISTDLQDAIDRVNAPLPSGRGFRSSEISPECILKATAQEMVHRFRQMREDWHASNRALADAEDEVKRLRKLCHRSAKYLAASNKLSDLMRGDSQLSELYIAMVAAVHLGDGREEG